MIDYGAWRELQTVKEMRLARNPLSAYIPHPKQLLFHQALKRIRAIFGGNRSGKTEEGAVEAIWHATGNYPDWYPAEGRMKQPAKGRIVVVDYEKGMGEIVQPKMKKWLPDYGKMKIEKYKNIAKKYDFPNGSTIDVLTHEASEDGQKKHEGADLDFVWFDEPPPNWAYKANWRGCVDRGGRMWFTLTPLTQPWIHDEIYIPGMDGTDPLIWAILQSIYDNPHIGRKEIEEFESKLDEDEKEARIHGRFMFLAGLIYKMLNAQAHLAEESDDVPGDAAYWMVLDPHDRRPSAFAWFWRDETGDIEFFDEMWIEDRTIAEYVELIAAKEESWGIAGKVSRVIDPLFGNKQYGNTKRTVKDEYRRAGLDIGYPMSFRDANNDIAYGHGLVREYLRYDKKKPIGVENHPKLQIRRNCKMTWFQMNRYIWDEYKGRASEDREAKDAPKDKHKDFPDCVRYGVAAVHRHGVFAEPPRVERSRSKDYERRKTGKRLASSMRRNKR